MNHTPLPEDEAAAARHSLDQLAERLKSVIFGQETLIETVITGLVAQGHMLLEGLPGLGKTELVRTLSRALSLETRRVQFTPDLLPGDITGNPILEEKAGTRRFVFQPGPVFCNVLLADEINRASPKTQSALLEAMQERRVTVLGESHALPAPFFVLATQNPIELEGTYPLPEAQLDRFLFKLEVTRNPVDVLEKIIMHREIGVDPVVEPVLDRAAVESLCATARRVYLPPAVANYIARLVNATHPGESDAAAAVKFGASPRAAIALAAASRARALRLGRAHAAIEDIQALAPFVLGHRILLDYAARIEGMRTSDVVARLLEELPTQDKSVPKSLQALKV